jgi:hypothetical protein
MSAQEAPASSRYKINHLTDLVAVGAEVWHEMDLWQRWNETGRDALDFQAWLDGREANLGGFARRAAMGRGMYDVVRSSLEVELADSPQSPTAPRDPATTPTRPPGATGCRAGRSTRWARR